MSLLLVNRPARSPVPEVPQGPVAVLDPPTLPTATGSSWVTYLFPVLGSAGSLVFVLVNPSPVYVIGGLLFALGSIGMGVGLYFSQRSLRRGSVGEDRRRYLDHLRSVREDLAETAAQQRAAALWRHPDPRDVPATVHDGRRLWERRRSDDDFLSVRLGRGDEPLARSLTLDTAPSLSEAEPVSGAALRRLQQAYGVVPDVPVAVDLRGLATVSVLDEGPGRVRARALLRAVLLQATAFSAPEDLRIAVCAGPEARPHWDWVKWLPHVQHPDASDATGTVRLVAGDLAELDALLGAELDQRRRGRRNQTGGPGLSAVEASAQLGPHLLVVVDAEPGAPGSTPVLAGLEGLGVTVLRLVDREADEPSSVDLRWRLADGLRLEPLRAAAEGDAPLPAQVRPDQVALPQAEAWARYLAPVRLSASAPDRTLVQTLELPELLGVPDVGRLDPAATWAPRPLREQLRVPLGVDPDGLPVVLDLKESALDGMGPHGLVVGATGSGKSELLRTLVTGLAVTHSPEVLSFVLVDFKGGATFAGMADLPHVAGVVTNLQDDLAMVDRFHAALFGEMDRRQELLRAAGSLSSVREYAARRDEGADLEPLPSLLVIVDEFSELLAQKPDFIDLFVALGRLGRSLGMHLLFSSQRLDEGRLRGLESHLSYRIGLRTFSAAESRAVLGVPDAYELPPVPGSAYLKVDVSSLQRLRAAMVSGPYREQGERPVEVPDVAVFDARSPEVVDAPPAAFEPDPQDVGRRSVMGVAIDRLAAAAPATHQVWLPPLEPELELGELLGPLADLPGRGLQATDQELGTLRVPVGVVDLPREQRRRPLVVDLSGPAGSLAVVGGPQSGKSTFLRTLITAACLTHTPDELQFAVLDLGGGLLASLAGAPHVGTVATRSDPERVRRVVGEVHQLLEHREAWFPAAGVDGVAAFRARRAAGRLPADEVGDVVLVLDDWTAVRREFEELEPLLLDLAARGLGYGIHVVLTAARWLDVRTNVRDHLQGRLELRLGEPSDSLVDRKKSAQLPTTVPGRGLAQDGSEVQVALPRVAPYGEADGDLAPALEALTADLRARWTGRPARPVRLLPAHLPYSALPSGAGDPEPGIPIGIGEADLQPARVELTGTDGHLLVFGDSESGKTGVLRTLLAAAAERRTPEQLRIVAVDYRRGLLGAVSEEHLLEYAGAEPAATAHVAELATVLRRRLPGPDVTPAQLRARNWWTGPDVYLVVDDYDLVVTQTSNPLLPLLDLLPQAQDVGLHLVLARRVAGTSRSMFEPVLTRVRELGAQGLLLSGDPGEGPLLDGVRAAPYPPGRGLLVRRRRRPLLVQTAWLEPQD